MENTPHGIIPAMITPFTMDDTINDSALRNLTDHLIEQGVHGLFATGSQGEFWALSADERQHVWEVIVDTARGRVPVLAGTACPSTRETIALTQRAERAGVDAVSVLTPFFVTPTEDELYEHYCAVAASTGLPVLLYSNPGRTGVTLSPALVEQLAAVENIVGIKDSSGDLQLTAQYIQGTPSSFSVLMGRDTLILAGLLYGADGSIAATGNVAPALLVSIYESFRSGDSETSRRCQEALAPIRLAFSWGTFPVVVKEALNLMGFEVGPARAPISPLAPEKRECLRDLLRGSGLI